MKIIFHCAFLTIVIPCCSFSVHRGYAATCRVKFEAKKLHLSTDIASLDGDLAEWVARVPHLVGRMRSQLALERTLDRRMAKSDEDYDDDEEELAKAEEIVRKLEKAVEGLI